MGKGCCYWLLLEQERVIRRGSLQQHQLVLVLDTDSGAQRVPQGLRWSLLRVQGIVHLQVEAQRLLEQDKG